MRTRLHVLCRRPAFLLGVAAFLLAVVVQSGELGTSDTAHRLQVAHWIWTSEPQVFPNEYPEFGIHGRSGKLYAWYGIGQSLLMLPFDIIGTGLERLPAFSQYTDDPSLRVLVVAFGVSTLVSVLTALIAFRLLRLLGFTVNHSTAGVLALLFCTTHLHYSQNMMENNYIMLLTLAGLTYQYQWLRSGGRRALLIGSAALGLNLLTRLTTGMDLIAVGVFLLLVAWFTNLRGREVMDRAIQYAKVAAPVYGCFFLLDRLYQFYRFGSFFNTYLTGLANEQKSLNPGLPPNYPFETPFRAGFFGALFAPEKSIFLFDPLLLLSAVLAMLLWSRFAPEIKAYVLATVLLLFAHISFYARYTVWSGDFAWGDRYVSTAAELVAFISVPVLLRYHQHVGRFVRAAAILLIAVSALIQVASLALWLPLEIYQMETLGHPTFVIGLRFKNIVAFALGKRDAWGLVNYAMKWDDWDYLHISTWNFLPFVLKTVGRTPHWVVILVTFLWGTAIAGLLAVLEFIRRKAKGDELQAGTIEPAAAPIGAVARSEATSL